MNSPFSYSGAPLLLFQSSSTLNFDSITITYRMYAISSTSDQQCPPLLRSYVLRIILLLCIKSRERLIGGAFCVEQNRVGLFWTVKEGSVQRRQFHATVWYLNCCWGFFLYSFIFYINRLVFFSDGGGVLVLLSKRLHLLKVSPGPQWDVVFVFGNASN